MKPLFVTSSVESIKYLRGETVVNKPVNLSLCKSIEKGKFNWYPDNEGIPSIKFNGCDTQWVYNDEDTRNKDYEILKNNKF